jgi:alpha-glucosidase (family GH31 glycosyl hydrolase)
LKPTPRLPFAFTFCLLALYSPAVPAQEPPAGEKGFILAVAPNLNLQIEFKGFRISFVAKGESPRVVVPAHAVSGLLIGPAGGEATDATVVRTGRMIAGDHPRFDKRATAGAEFDVKTAGGIEAIVDVFAGPGWVKFAVKPKQGGAYTFKFRHGPVDSPAYGLGDHAAAMVTSTDVTGYENLHMRSGNGALQRQVSNFVIFPKARFAEINFEPREKIVRIKEDEVAQGTVSAAAMPAMYCFFGEPTEIYKAYQDVRNAEGYKCYLPKPEFFGVGWEAFGALGWKTDHQTVSENVQQYLDAGYPLRWMVVGSGFWPNEEKRFRTTTSFGRWDKTRYPDPKGFIDHFKGKGLKFFIGLRISFITDGPYSAEGVAKGYFLKDESGKAKVYNIAFPNSPCYLLDAHNPDALKWYMALVDKWVEFGVDGFKEDLFGYGKYPELRDDKIDPVNEAMMDRGLYVMQRNAYTGTAAELHRFEDFNQDQNQDRGPLNGLTNSYSGFPYTYPDIVGGTFGEGRKMPGFRTPLLKAYIMRNAQWASVNPGMAMGIGPWNFEDEQVSKVVLDAAKLHDRLHPMIYSAAVETAHTGFPYTMTPLPLAYPDDKETYALENTTRRGYQWLIAPSLMATPLYGNDYATADSRDVYLPAGRWIDYDTGEAFDGPRTLAGYKLPFGKTPLFVGGKGIVLERRGGKPHARVYEVATAPVEHTFFGFDAKPLTAVKVNVKEWKRGKLTVVDAVTRQPVKADRVEHAIDFVVEPGKRYEVTD